MKEKTVVLATRNTGKIAEFTSLFNPFGFVVLGLDHFPDAPEVEETGTTFIENARLKACAVSTYTGLVSIADDSGLEVDALQGAPGIYSARYSELAGKKATDARNIEKLLKALEGVPLGQRGARFRCSIVVCSPEGKSFAAEGVWAGEISPTPSGANGFGYDPVFFDRTAGCTAAEMTADEKNARSHRGKAIQNMLLQWDTFWHTLE